MHALVYFQLRGLWKMCKLKIERFSQQLRRQQEERERRRQLIDYDQVRHQALTSLSGNWRTRVRRLTCSGAQLKVMEANLAAMRGFWNYFRRRRLNEEVLKSAPG